MGSFPGFLGPQGDEGMEAGGVRGQEGSSWDVGWGKSPQGP